ncbi:MAG TPA: class I SAM-dependent methyltransferase [Vicinamibacterales bacterium]|nr:class I SAM-dependent methyltransferase [Vicinamibacterales bacterium]
MPTGPAARAAYELWAGTYPPVAHNPVMRAEQSVVEPLLARSGARRALDVGTGSGRYLPILQSTGARVVVGVDFSMAMLAGGRAVAGGARICADAMRLPFRRGAFDVINSSLMVGDVADLHAWAREVARVLARGGQLVYSDFHPTWIENGWRRTFRTSGGDEHEIAIEPHTIDDHLAAMEAAGLTALAIREPRISAGSDGRDPSVRSFQKQWGDPPVVVAFHAVKQPERDWGPAARR